MRMTTLSLALAMLMLASITTAEAAKRCRRLCRDQVRACVTDAKARIVCAGLKGHDRRDCMRTLHTAVRDCKSMQGPILSLCKASTSADSCSPSGAFVE
jgi:hypothetical protein